MRKYAQSQAEIFRSTHHLPGSAGFIVNSFMSSGFDKETGEIFKDDWDAEAEIEGIRLINGMSNLKILGGRDVVQNNIWK